MTLVGVVPGGELYQYEACVHNILTLAIGM